MTCFDKIGIPAGSVCVKEVDMNNPRILLNMFSRIDGRPIFSHVFKNISVARGFFRKYSSSFYDCYVEFIPY